MLKYFGYLRTILVVLVLIYTFLPYDILPDFVFGWGWLDDLVIIYLLWRFFFQGLWPRRKPPPTAGSSSGPYHGYHDTEREQSHGPAHGGRTAGKTPYEVLNLPAEASRDEIRAAYKRLVRQYHPDKVAHLGEEFRVLAERRFKEIQEAYQTLMGQK